MKKISILLNVLLIAFIVFEACDPRIFPAVPAVIKPSCPDCANYDYSAGSGTGEGKGNVAGLSINTADMMSLGYKTNCQPKLNPNPVSGQDARSIWFSVETLKEFIFNIEKASCNKKCTEKLELGVRIYYAQYPNTNTLVAPSTTNSTRSDLQLLTTTKTDYQLNHTVFMVPTYDKLWNGNTKVHIDFDPWHMGENCNAPISFDSLRRNSPTDQKALILSPEQPQYGRLNPKLSGTKSLVDNSLLQNHGSIIPPDVNIGPAF